MSRVFFIIFCSGLLMGTVADQTAVKVPRPGEKDRAQRAVGRQQEKKGQRASVIEFRGQAVIDGKVLGDQR